VRGSRFVQRPGVQEKPGLGKQWKTR
jgi:hypothetical protein